MLAGRVRSLCSYKVCFVALSVFLQVQRILYIHSRAGRFATTVSFPRCKLPWYLPPVFMRVLRVLTSLRWLVCCASIAGAHVIPPTTPLGLYRWSFKNKTKKNLFNACSMLSEAFLGCLLNVALCLFYVGSSCVQCLS